MTNPFEGKFSASTEELPPSDPRDAAVKSLNSKCRNLIELAHALQGAEHNLEAAKTENPINVEKLSKAARDFGMLEERFYNLMDVIEKEHRSYVQDKGMSIFLVHTESGMPIRVNDKCRKRIWD